ncbi:MAG: cytochrome c biogenesis protein [Desulfovibrio sp.]|jgi:heme exporter protein C|nr:cytochrome c biogenesis protein [Desulfovibrio sp.]
MDRPLTPAGASRFPGLLFPAAPWLALAGGMSLAACQWRIFAHTPAAENMGLSQKIFYLHLPLAWWGLFSFFLVFAAGIAFLKTRRAMWDSLGLAATEAGLLFSSLALLSGMIWAHRAWGVWWTWDARLSTTLVMCFLYAGCLLIQGLRLPPERRRAIRAALGIAAFLDVPLVFFSARLWSYIHPPAITLDPEMKFTLLAALAALGPLWMGLLLLRWQLAEDETRLETLARERLLREPLLLPGRAAPEADGTITSTEQCP